MDRTLLFVAFIFAFTKVSGQTLIHSTEAPITGKQKVIASAVTSDNRLFVFVGQQKEDEDHYNEKGKVILMQYDSARKLILKKPIVVPAVGKSKIRINGAFEVGSQLVVCGLAIDDKKSIITTAYFTIDEKTMVAAKTATKMLESEQGWVFFSTFENKYDFSQTKPGAPLGVEIMDRKTIKLNQTQSTTEYSSHYFMIDTEARLHDVLKVAHKDESGDKSSLDFIVGNDGMMYILTASFPHTEYDFEAGDYTEDSKKRLREGEFTMELETYSPATKGGDKFRFQFANFSLMCEDIVMHNEASGVYVSGFAGNAAHNFQRIMNDDTAGVKYQRYVFSQKIDGLQMHVKVSGAVMLSEALYDEMVKDPSISEQDRDIGNEESLDLLGANMDAHGNVRLTAIAYVHWDWPPYAEIKNDKRYELTKDDDGSIVSISGPSYSRKFDYQSVVTLTLDNTKNEISGSKKSIDFQVTHDFRDRSANPKDRFLNRQTSTGNALVYIKEKEGDDARLNSVDSDKGEKTYISYPSEMSYAPGSSIMISSSVLILNGKNEFLIVDLLE